MSDFTDDAGGVQPDQGQGDAGEAGDSPYSEYLSRFEDDDARQIAAEAFKEFDGKTTQRFQDAANFRRQWEPYQETGIADMDPEMVSWLAQFGGIVNDPRAVQSWYEQYAQQQGLESGGGEDTTFDEYGSQLDQNTIKQLIQQELAPYGQLLEQHGQRWQETDQQQAERQLEEQIDAQHAPLEKKYGDAYNRNKAEQYALDFADENPDNAIALGWQAWMKERSQIEQDALNKKLGVPPGAEPGGQPDSNLPTPKRIDDPEVRERAAAVLRNMNSQR